MLVCETNKVSEFKRIINSISALVDDGAAEITKDGIKIRAIDPSQIAMISVNIPVFMFSKFELDKEMNVGINFSEFSKILKRAKDEDILNIKIENEVEVKLIGKASREFKFGLIESSAPSREPKIETTATIKISGKLIKDFIGDIESISTKINFNISRDKFIITSSSDEEGTSGKIEISDENLIGKEVKEDAKATFSIEYLKDLMAG
ncbi:MAG: hypothetical protein ACK4YO_01630, partial [Candidatus Altarchaeaceae archaeon]